MICLSMLVRNEADRYLSRVLAAALPHVDVVSVIDDASEDDTPDLVLRMCSVYGKPVTLTRRTGPGFATEWKRSSR